MSRAAQLDCQHLRSCALVLTLFLFQKGQGFFPPLPIAALLPRSWRWAYLPPCGDSASVTVGVVQSCPLRGNGILMLGRFWKVIGQRVRRARAMRPVAEWRSESATKQGVAQDPRGARPVAERR